MRYLLTIISCLILFTLSAQDTLHNKLPDSLTMKLLNEVTVYASRIPERILQSPVSVEKVNEGYFNKSAAPSFFDALENVKGVQMITPSLGFRILNTRGFANTTNVRFAQLVDGMDVQSPHISSPIGSSLGPGDLDIENVEILPGVASALYGMNTINGLVNISTKNPFTTPGFSCMQKTGVTHAGDANSDPKIFSETSFRFAHVIDDRLAFKINATYTKGYDWIVNNYADQNPDANTSTNLTGADNPGADPVNSYGNESSDRKTISLGGKNYVVARTGYLERELVDYSLQNIKADAGIYYKFHNQNTVSYSFHFALLDNIYQRANRFRLQNYFLQQQAIQYQSKSLQAKIYFNNENSGKSYNLRSMGENIDRGYKQDTDWYKDYTTGFNTAVQGGALVAAAHHLARTFADAGRYEPGTAAFNQALEKLQNINNWDYGAALRVKASFVQAEAQWNLSENFLNTLKTKAGVEVLAGFDHRTYIVFPDGNYFINPVKGKENDNIHYSKTGGFLSVTKTLLNSKAKIGAILRGDKNDYFPVLFNPRFTAVYSPAYNHNFRVAFQSGYRYPIIFEAYSNVNSGGVKRVGGLPVMSSGIFENAWLQSSITVFQSAVLTDINQNGLSKNAAIEKNKTLLRKNPYTYLQPEHVNSFEVGYKGVMLKRRLFVDLDFYFNNYRSFIAQANMNVPNTTKTDSIPYYLYDKTKQSAYRMWTNSKTVVHNYGISAGLTYRFFHGYTARGNVTYSKLKKSINEDGLEDGFNTPEWMTNISLGNENICKNFGAGATFRWQSKYLCQSFLVTANVPAYATVDAQISYTLRKVNMRIKTGASNLFNHYYYSIAGGPSIGGFYYVALIYGLK
ncbi:MAG: TonB-dependent receptor plug domain-containing protein [Bacteroidetes bacterium]|nr:TonB-dependent receptor plug domain-containing protein [Bacteroidota bacterium]